MPEDIQDYAGLFLAGTPLLDVRAPTEFERGAFPHATNLPLLDNDERHRIGICYKQNGQQAAIDLGHQLVSGAIKRQRVMAWAQWKQQHPDGLLYCFRGGLRSRTVQQWLAAEGVDIALVSGGYKALRRFLFEYFDQHIQQVELAVLCGRTGCGKTRVVEALDNAIDLEGLAHHRGSAFGRRPGGQPAQIDFENRLAIDLLRHQHAGKGRLVLEDESKLIGRCLVPLPLQARLRVGDRVIIEENLESRVQVTLDDYVVGPLSEYGRYYGEAEAFELLAGELTDALGRIRRRLGGDRYQALLTAMQAALDKQRRSGDPGDHASWIAPLLRDYYDPMYDYMLSRREGNVLFSGSRAQVLAFLDQPRTTSE